MKKNLNNSIFDIAKFWKAIGFGLHSVKARRVGRYGLMIVNSVGFLALLFSYTPLLIYWRLKQQKLE